MKSSIKLTVTFILCIALALSSCSLSNGHIRLFSDLHRSVSHEYRELAKEIYNQYCSEITEIWIAEDNRSHECIRFAFFSESALSKDVVENILDRVHETVQESRNKPDIGIKYFLSIEVFYIVQDVAREVYDSWYEKEIPGENGLPYTVFSEFFEVESAENRLSTQDIEIMMKRVGLPMFYDNDVLSDRSIKPHLPPY